MASFAAALAAVDWAHPSTFYMGSDELEDLADAAIKHSGLRLPVHSQILATHSTVLRGLFRSLREGGGGGPSTSASTELESPFSQHSLAEVVLTLRFLYHPGDATRASLKAAAAHVGGVVRLAHALDVRGPLLPAAEEYLAARVDGSAADALAWLPVAEACGLRTAWARGVRALARDVLTRPGGASGAFAAVRQLAGLSQDTCLAVLAAAAAGVRQLAEADEWEDVGSQAAHRLPQPHALAGWQEGDPSEFVWSLRNWTSRRGKQRSPAFAGPGGSQWQLQVYPRGNNGGAHSPWLALYLVCVDLEAGRGPPRPARFTLQVVNQDDGAASVAKGPMEHTFTQHDPDWGYTQFMELEVLRNSPGFIRNNAVQFRVRFLQQQEAAAAAAGAQG